jgi:hypothetical protein
MKRADLKADVDYAGEPGRFGQIQGPGSIFLKRIRLDPGMPTMVWTSPTYPHAKTTYIFAHFVQDDGSLGEAIRVMPRRICCTWEEHAAARAEIETRLADQEMQKKLAEIEADGARRSIEAIVGANCKQLPGFARTGRTSYITSGTIDLYSLLWLLEIAQAKA